ncbi:hypothetical protein [Falsirhodobacter algicola]|uniref:Uncharacterized protein n=1 Tax=Falsirhodobacter algicola TaxID=2692330 RepID=A0A8J8SKV9_9RHOB|nr:hypothetical protein [Falsirhodobacter algicola]QUS35759.1 hypothetical protein GR316_05495 [Falsirhodobacter algicola]
MAEPGVLAGTVLASGAFGMWLVLLVRRKRTERPPRLRLDGCSFGGAAGCIVWIAGLAWAEAGMGAVATGFCMGAALTALAARVALRDPVICGAWVWAGGCAAIALWSGAPMGVLAGAGFGVQAVLARRGDTLDRHASHLVLAAPAAILLLAAHPPLHGEVLVIALAAGAALALGGAAWHQMLRGPALAPLVLVLGVGSGFVLPALCGAAAVWGLQRMIGSNGS